MNDPTLKAAAFALADQTPRHLDAPTTPPILWRMEGSNLVVVLADGRKVRGPITDQRTPVKKQVEAPKIASLPVRSSKK